MIYKQNGKREEVPNLENKIEHDDKNAQTLMIASLDLTMWVAAWENMGITIDSGAAESVIPP